MMEMRETRWSEVALHQPPAAARRYVDGLGALGRVLAGTR